MSPRKQDSRPKPPGPEKDKGPRSADDDEREDGPPAEEAAPPRSGWAEGAAAADLEALRAENAELQDRVLRTMAEMENLRRRTERDKADTTRYAVSGFARDVLNVADNMARAIAAVPEGAADADLALKALVDGVSVTERELHNVLERHGIRKLDPKGERFDPHLHQAMLEMENKDVPAGTVVEVLQPGYTIGERVLRPALVAVSKGGQRRPKAGAPEADGDRSEEAGGPADEASQSRTSGADAPGGQVDRSA